MTRPRAALLAPLVALALGGCYTFRAASPATLPEGARVRVALTEAGAAALAPAIGGGVTAVEGNVVRRGGDTLVVRPDRLLTAARVDVAWSGDAVAVPAGWQRGVLRRRLAPGRTAALVAGSAVASAAFIALLRTLGDEQGDPGGGGGPITLSRGAP